MIFDKEVLLSDNQTLVINNGVTAVSTNTLDLYNGNTFPATGTLVTFDNKDALGNTMFPDLGRSTELRLLMQVTASATGASSVLTASVITSAAANLSSPTVIMSSAGIPMATLIAGYRFSLTVPPNVLTQRYFGVQYAVSGANMTGGTITTTLLLDAQTKF